MLATRSWYRRRVNLERQIQPIRLRECLDMAQLLMVLRHVMCLGRKSNKSHDRFDNGNVAGSLVIQLSSKASQQVIPQIHKFSNIDDQIIKSHQTYRWQFARADF
jgi:hypothetical protein